MYNHDTEILFPMRVLPSLREMHGDEWQKLVDHILSNEAAASDRYAFVLMMVRMCGCVGCNADSFRAMKGCTQCARQTVKRNRSTDLEIVEQYKMMQKEVFAYLKKVEADVVNKNQ